MKRLMIGNDLEVSPVALGCMRISDCSVDQVSRLIHTALDIGVNMFDHADIYAGGLCEELFGKCLVSEKGLRDQMVLQSKCGIRNGCYDLSREYILKSTEEILKRLNTEYLDVLLLHRPDTLMEPEEIAEAFTKLEKQGKVKHFGVSNMNPEQIKWIQMNIPQKIEVDQIQISLPCAGAIESGISFNVPNHTAFNDASILEYSQRKNIRLQAWSPLQYGFFEGNFINHEKFAELNQALSQYAEKYEVDQYAIAVAWLLRHPAGIEAIIGTDKPEHLISTAKAAQVKLTREEWYTLYCAAGHMLP